MTLSLTMISELFISSLAEFPPASLDWFSPFRNEADWFAALEDCELADTQSEFLGRTVSLLVLLFNELRFPIFKSDVLRAVHGEQFLLLKDEEGF